MFFCPHSATVEGLLSFYPHVRERLNVHVIDYPRPRKDIITEIGEAHQACPVLILPPGFARPKVASREAEGRLFFVGATEIAGFLAEWAGIGLPHP